MKLEKRINTLLKELQEEGFSFCEKPDSEEVKNIVRQIEQGYNYGFMSTIRLAEDKPFKEKGGQFTVRFNAKDNKFEMEASYSNQKIDLDWLNRASRIEFYVRNANCS